MKFGLDIGAPAKDNETQEDTLYYRRYGYYPGTHAYAHPRSPYGVIGANESGEGAADNKTEEDAILFYRRHGYYPGWYRGRYHPFFYDNKAKEDEIHYGPPRRYGAYYPGYHYTTGRVVGHVPAFYDNEQKVDNAPKEEASAVANFL